MTAACRMLLPLLAAALAALVGCGGGPAEEGIPLKQQYENAMAIENAEYRARELLVVAGRQNGAADVLGAENSLAKALEASQFVENEKEQLLLRGDIAYAQSELGFKSDAKKTLMEVKANVGLLDEEDLERKTRLFAKLGVAYANLEQPNTAAAQLKEGEEFARRVNRPQGKVESLLEIAYAYYRIERKGDAQRTVDEALAAARAIEGNPVGQVASIAAVGQTLTRMKLEQRGKDAFAAAGKAAAALDDDYRKGNAWYAIAERQMSVGMSAAAGASLEKAEAAAKRMTDPSLRKPLLNKIAQARR